MKEMIRKKLEELIKSKAKLEEEKKIIDKNYDDLCILISNTQIYLDSLSEISDDLTTNKPKKKKNKTKKMNHNAEIITESSDVFEKNANDDGQANVILGEVNDELSEKNDDDPF